MRLCDGNHTSAVCGAMRRRSGGNHRRRVRTCVRAVGEPDNRRGRAYPSARLREPGCRPPLRCARGAGDAVLRGPGEVRAEPRARAVPHAVPVDDQPVQGLQSWLPLLLRPPHPRLPRPERRARLREGDRRQGQRARGAAARAGAAVVEGRARRDGDEHRPVPVGRGPLQAHARDLGGAAGRSQPLLDPHEVAARPARPRPPAGDRAGRGDQRVVLRADARREGLAADRAAHAEPAGAARGGRRAEPGGHPDAAILVAPLMPGINDDPAQVDAILAPPRRPGRRPSAASACTCAARCATSSWAGCATRGRISCPATRSSTPAAPTRRRPSASGCRRSSRAAGSAGEARVRAARPPAPGRAAPPPEPAQESLF